MRKCMICETPYSVLNSINYAFHDKREHSLFDLYIGNNFKNSIEIAERIKTYKLFDHVWMYKKTSESVSFFNNIKRKVFPWKYLTDVVVDRDYEFTAYDEVYLTSATRFPTSMILACREAKVYFIEDGLSSYYDRIYIEPLSKFEKLISILAGRGYQRAFPKVVYLNNPGLCVNDVRYETRQLPLSGQNDTRFQELLYHIFDHSLTDQYAAKRIIYLAQCLEADLKMPGIFAVEEQVEAVLSLFKDDVLYRPHPRNQLGEKNGLCIDKICNMWELVCMNDISDDTILVGCYSSALFTPKMIHDKEPWLIFTYQLYGDFLGDLKGRIESMVHRIMQAYRDPEKVICVGNIEDMEQCIRRIIKK